MPLRIQRKSSNFNLKKRHLTLTCIVLCLSIIIYRACNVAYHFRALTLGKIVMEELEVLKISKNDHQENSNPFYIEVTLNSSKCTCPVFLEISDINGILYLKDAPNEELHSLRVKITNIKFDKQKPFEFKAGMEFRNVNFNTPIFDLIALDFFVEVSFLIRARFCLVPLCFSKIIRRKKSEILMKGGESIDSSYLSSRLHTIDDIPCLQLGIKKGFFTSLYTDSRFTFNVGCMKISFEGIVDFFVILTSFSTDNYILDGDMAATDDCSSFESITRIMPGVPIDSDNDPEESIVFFFISIPLYNFGNILDIPKLITKIKEVKPNKLLLIKSSSALVNNDKHEVKDLRTFLSGCASKLEHARFDVISNNICKIIKYIKIPEKINIDASKTDVGMPKFLHGWKSLKTTLIDLHSTPNAFKNLGRNRPSLNAKKIETIVSIKNWFLDSNSFEFTVSLNEENPIFVGIENALKLIPFLGIKNTVKFSLFLDTKKYVEFSVSLNVDSNNPGNLLLISGKILEKLSFGFEDIKKFKIILSELIIGEYTLIIPELFHISVNYPKSINIIGHNNFNYTLYEFKKSKVQNSIILEHFISAFMNSNVVGINTKVDLSTFGYLKKRPVKFGNSFISLEVPEISFSVLNSFIKLKSTLLKSTVDFSLSKRLSCRGIVEAFTTGLFHKSWDPTKFFTDAFLDDIIYISMANNLISFRYKFNRQENNGNNIEFLRIFPMELVLNKQNPFGDMSHINFTISNTYFEDKSLFEDYMKCMDPKVYQKHKIFTNFIKSQILPSEINPNFEGPFFIKNVLKANNAAYVRFLRGLPLVSVEVDKGGVIVVLTSNKIFLYLEDKIDLRVKPLSGTDRELFRYHHFKWLEDYPLYNLAEFLFEAITSDTVENIKYNSLLKGPRMGNFNIKTSYSVIEKGLFHFKISIPKFSVFSFCVLNIQPFFRAEIKSYETKDFLMSFELKNDQNEYVLEIFARMEDKIYYETQLIQVFMDFNSVGIYQFSSHLLLNWLYKFLFTFGEYYPSDFIYQFNYSSIKMIRAFSSESNNLINEIYYVFQKKKPVPAASNKIYIPPVLDLSFNNILGLENSITFDINLGIDSILLAIGGFLEDLLCRFPLKVIPEFIILDFDFNDFLSFSSTLNEDYIAKTLFYFKIILFKCSNSNSIKIPIRSRDYSCNNNCSTSSNILNADKNVDNTNISVDNTINVVNDINADDAEVLKVSSLGFSYLRFLSECLYYKKLRDQSFFQCFHTLGSSYLCNFSVGSQQPCFNNFYFIKPKAIIDQYRDFKSNYKRDPCNNILNLAFEVGSDKICDLYYILINFADFDKKFNFSGLFGNFLLKLFEFSNNSESANPILHLNYTQEGIVLVSLLLPFTIRILDDQFCMSLFINSTSIPIIVLRNMLFDCNMASRGYYVSFPIVGFKNTLYRQYLDKYRIPTYYPNINSNSSDNSNSNFPENLKLYFSHKKVAFCYEIESRKYLRLLAWCLISQIEAAYAVLKIAISRYITLYNYTNKYCLISETNDLKSIQNNKINVETFKNYILEVYFPADKENTSEFKLLGLDESGNSEALRGTLSVLSRSLPSLMPDVIPNTAIE